MTTISFLRRRALALMARREPDFYIGGRENPYMLRWWVIPRNRLFNIYLHRFMRDDEDRALHDHPWHSLSIVLQVGYWEHMPGGKAFWRKPGSLIFRRPTDAHRIALACLGTQPLSAVSLFITGPRLRTWGFHCPKGFVPWQDFVAETDVGNIGRGCGEKA
jgi:hypothetical protein